MTVLTPVRSADLLDTLGICTHIKYTDGQYVNVPKTLECLDYIGLKHLRDSPPNVNGQGEANYLTIAKAGYDFCLTALPSLTDFLSQARKIEAVRPGSVIALEGPNEVNNWPPSYNGKTGRAAAFDYQTDLYKAVKADAVFKALPVLAFTDEPPQKCDCDIGNVHPYTRRADQPSVQIAFEVGRSKAVLPDKPVWITETGYLTLPGVSGFFEGVTEEAQAAFTLTTFLDAFVAGVKRTYLYQLFEDRPDYLSKTQGNHFGLFDLLYRPKPAATALRTLTGALKDTAAFTPVPIDIAVSGPENAFRWLPIQRSDKKTSVILWDTRDVWDEGSDKALSLFPQTVTIEVGSGAGAPSALSGLDLVTGAPVPLTPTGGSLRIPVTLQGGAVIVGVN